MKTLLFFLLLIVVCGSCFAQEARLVLPVGHTGGVKSVVFSADEKLAITSSQKTIMIWECKTGKLLRIFEGSSISPDSRYIATIETNSVYIHDIEKNKSFFLQKEHKTTVSCIQFSPNSKILTTISDGVVCNWDVTNGNELSVLTEDTGLISGIIFSPDSKIILTESQDKTIRIWDVLSGKQLGVLSRNINYLFDIDGRYIGAAFSPDCNYIAVISDSIIRIWDVLNNHEFHVLKGHTKLVTFAVFSPDSKFILTGSNDGTTRIWDVLSGKQLSILSGHYTSMYAHFDEHSIVGSYSGAVFSPDSRLLFTTNYDGTIHVKNILDNHELRVLNAHTELVNFVVFSPDGKLMFTGSDDGTARIWDLSSGKEVHVLNGHTSWVLSAQFSRDGQYVITGSEDHSARIWDVVSGKLLHVLEGLTDKPESISSDTKSILSNSRIWELSSVKDLIVLQGDEKDIVTSAFSSDGKLVLTTSKGGTARVYEVSSGRELHVLIGHSKDVALAVFSPDGKMILTESWDQTTRIWDVSTGTEIKKYDGVSFGALFSPDSKLLLISTTDSTISLLELFSDKVLFTLGHDNHKIQRKGVFSKGLPLYSFSPDSKTILTPCKDKCSRIYDVSTGKELQVFSGHKNQVSTARFNTNANLVISSSSDSTARIFEVASGKELQTLKGHTATIRLAWFSPDSKYAITQCWDGIIRTWDLSSGKELYELRFNSEQDIIQFTPDSKYIITTGSDHKTIIWDATTGNPLYTRLQLKNNNWLIYDEHHRYDGSQGARDYLYFVCGLEVVDLAQVKDALYTPNLMQRIMNGENLDHLPKLKDLEICGVSPQVEPLEDKKDGGFYYKITPGKGGVGRVEIYINGMLRQTVESASLTKKEGVYELKVDKSLVTKYQITGQETEVKVIAKTASNTISSRGATTKATPVKIAYKKPHLHAIMIGIDDYKGEGLDLNYAAKDAIDLQKALELSAKKFFNTDDTNRVHFYNLTVDRAGNIGGKTPDRNNILQAISTIEKESKVEDVLLLFFAGHGEINKNKQLILLTADASKEQAPDYIGITMKELLEKLATIPAGKRVLLLDACHSGAAINELNLQDLAGTRDSEDSEKQTQRLKELENLASKSGLAIITASSSDQKALELPQYEHGLMTYALLTTMLSEPNALNQENHLQLEDWLRETEKAVSKLGENQSAQRFVPLNFSLGKVDEEVRKSVDLMEIPTVLIANVLNIGSGDDDLELKNQLKNHLSEVSTRGGNEKVLLAEKEYSSTILVNITYEHINDKIESRITIKKNKVVLKQFNYNGSSADLPAYTKGLASEILKNIRD